MGTNCLLVARGRDLVLIDTGIGDKHEPRFMDIYALDPAGPAGRLPESIRRAGYELGDVTHVILSHLHFDHCGWNTRRDEGGRIVPLVDDDDLRRVTTGLIEAPPDLVLVTTGIGFRGWVEAAHGWDISD